MKTVGLLEGMSWGSTVGYYRAINEGVQCSLAGLHSAKIAMYSVDFDPIEIQQKDDWKTAARLLAEAAKKRTIGGRKFSVYLHKYNA